MSFDKIFSMRDRLNENRWKADRAKYQGGDQKIVAVPLEKRTSFKVKLVNFQSVLDPSGNLTAAGFNAIINWLRQQSDFILDYPYLNDTAKYFLTYEVLKDSELLDKEVIKFEIKDRASFPNIASNVDFVSYDQVGLPTQAGPANNTVAGTTVLNSNVKKFGKTNYGFSVPTAGAFLKGNQNPKIIAFIQDAYLAIRTSFTYAAAHPGMAKVMKEVDAGKLGPATQSFVHALNAGFNFTDYADRPRKDIHQDLINEIADLPRPSKVKESARPKAFLHPNGSRLILEGVESFDENAFYVAFTSGAGSFADTGGVTVPSEGFQLNVTKGDAELKKLQLLMRKGLAPHKNLTAVRPLIIAKDSNLGGYGTATQKAVGFIKRNGTVGGEKWADNDDTIITPEFAAWMLKALNLVKESKSTGGLIGAARLNEKRVYLAPDGIGLIYEMEGRFIRLNEDINSSGEEVYVPPPPPKPKPVTLPDGTVVNANVAKANAAVADLKLFVQGGVAGYEYIVSNGKIAVKETTAGKLDTAKLQGFPLKRKEGDTGPWQVVHAETTSTAEAKACVKANPAEMKEKAYFPDLRPDKGFPNNKSLYKYTTAQDGKSVTWDVKLWGAPSFQALDTTLPENAELITWLNNNYWKSAAVATVKTSADLFKEQQAIVAQIDGWFPGEFSSFSGWNDDEDAAVSHMQSSLWPNVKSKLDALDKSIDLVQDESQKSILVNNQKKIRNISDDRYDPDYNSNTFYDKMYGGTSNDTYTIAIKNPETGSIETTDVNTDF